ncbi:hypothetical protein HK096_004463, partial [Nowakowskiella sp. JEL0078]
MSTPLTNAVVLANACLAILTGSPGSFWAMYAYKCEYQINRYLGLPSDKGVGAINTVNPPNGDPTLASMNFQFKDGNYFNTHVFNVLYKSGSVGSPIGVGENKYGNFVCFKENTKINANADAATIVAVCVQEPLATPYFAGVTGASGAVPVIQWRVATPPDIQTFGSNWFVNTGSIADAVDRMCNKGDCDNKQVMSYSGRKATGQDFSCTSTLSTTAEFIDDSQLSLAKAQLRQYLKSHADNMQWNILTGTVKGNYPKVDGGCANTCVEDYGLPQQLTIEVRNVQDLSVVSGFRLVTNCADSSIGAACPRWLKGVRDGALVVSQASGNLPGVVVSGLVGLVCD